MTIDFFKMLLPLLLVLGLIVLAAKLLQHLQTPRQNNLSLMTIQAAISVGPKERVVLVKVADQWLVLGVAPGQVNTLMTLTEPVIQAENNATINTTFAKSWLDRYRSASL